MGFVGNIAAWTEAVEKKGDKDHDRQVADEQTRCGIVLRFDPDVAEECGVDARDSQEVRALTDGLNDVGKKCRRQYEKYEFSTSFKMLNLRAQEVKPVDVHHQMPNIAVHKNGRD